MKKLLILLFCLLSVSLFSLFGSVFGLLKYQSSGYDWEWLGLPFIGSGVQVARTKDTHQLLLRKLYLPSLMEVSVYTTMDNKLVLQVTLFQDCKANLAANLKFNKGEAQSIELTCDEKGALRYSKVVRHLNSINLAIDGTISNIDFSEWNLSELQKDQFKQLHPEYFQRLGEGPKYQWSRD